MAGGGGLKKKVINYVLDNPVKAYIGGAAFLCGVRWFQTRTTYKYHFGKIDFDRRLERGELRLQH